MSESLDQAFLSAGQTWQSPGFCHLEITRRSPTGLLNFIIIDADESRFDGRLPDWVLANFLEGSWALAKRPVPESPG